MQYLNHVGGNTASTKKENIMKAYEYCKNAATTMEQRGKENGYDNAKEERSAKQVAAVFNALTGRDLTEQEAWTFLICLKLVRQHRKHQEDNIVDLVAYSALLGESYMTVHDEIQVDTTAAQYDSLKGWPIATSGTWHPSASVGMTVKAANFGVVDQDVQPMVVLTGEDGSKILMTPEDFRNMEKTLVRSALK
ncbi:hypothetical protein [Escherichia phage vb_EcoS_bov16_1]|uniref:DUF6378 domain-containing protein n=1 Tax=Escherichia phage vb_EcoS_bov22_1 TaxID=2763527 RepID=A0AAE7MCZ1_9CAUD|nr:hypothetical protein P9631_gp05 [Escherichia phage vb_EcoS_bov22_1]QNR53548.1 hypothetical protein [Escherichia phage vb_EcoS_bov11C2]QNR53622.1 hypothetical protein [Escherichia phage vb_EcoS_bov16_1]QNR53671.1 hypothetical protein [Escherichia phage vb_EcoS_bov22_1]QNR53758.1 hypothetical protein [Escherichia phage vb_EcoS_bov25_1D]